MKLCSLLFLLMVSSLRAADWLDQPIRLAGKDPVEILYQMTAALGPEDRRFFEPAYLAWRAEFMVRSGYAVVPEETKERAFAEFIDGLTPRKLIISGLMLRARNENSRDEFESVLAGEELAKRREHMRKHTKDADMLVAAALVRYAAARAGRDRSVTTDKGYR
jgi:hypothetical protein